MGSLSWTAALGAVRPSGVLGTGGQAVVAHAGGKTAPSLAVGLRHRLWALADQTAAIFPGSRKYSRRDAQLEPSSGATFHSLATPTGQRIATLSAAAADADGSPLPDARERPTLLFFYGNDMCLRIAVPVVELLRRTGMNVVAPEYVGYGLSEGRPSEAGCYATADAVYAHVTERLAVDPARVVACGCSLGGAVAIDLAARRKVAGLATIVTFTSLADMARRFFPYLPVSLVVRHRFENLRKIATIGCPTLIGHSTEDHFVPMSMADRLAEAAGGPVTRLTVEGAGHSSESWLAVAGGTIAMALREFVANCT